jgi:hypothetical protein
MLRALSSRAKDRIDRASAIRAIGNAVAGRARWYRVGAESHTNQRFSERMGSST